eukprot:CAMPEP_0204908108 /NCGR_PEP_ID=MMETSP1397-20131031/7116_1 /ASSEMBLY_ACC=CAM_ASM_000891 /TAXON_ID=49980 /ORGANISM="Climacostomum Climacostomum virens, Strain Stock W-24" /LENGTH=336 /DNA_ID=CAMNT_0052077495 /DNA_START=30 /DNA_END=1040 /DNA_ORIENTATION=-
MNPYNEDESSTEDQKLDKKIEKVKQEYDNLRHESNEPLRKKIQQKLHKLIKKLENEKTIRKVDKIMFVIGMLRLAIESFLLGRAPCQFYLVHTFVGCVLLISRFCYYRWMHWHYFMLDFCYLANILTLCFLWVWPDSVWLYSAIYSYSMGPLLIAVPMFHNAYVPHSMDRMTSIFIHLWPGVTLWTIRYNSCDAWPAATAMPSFYDYSLASVSYYSIWFVCYSFIIFYATFERCEKKQNLTLYKYSMEENPGFANLCGVFGENLRKPMFMISHIATAYLPLMATYVTLYSYWLQGFILLGIFLCSLWTSANYFMDIFSKNYDLRMQQLQQLSKKLT